MFIKIVKLCVKYKNCYEQAVTPPTTYMLHYRTDTTMTYLRTRAWRSQEAQGVQLHAPTRVRTHFWLNLGGKLQVHPKERTQKFWGLNFGGKLQLHPRTRTQKFGS